MTTLPNSESLMHGRCARAITVGLDLAQQLGVDLWLTEDHIHFLRLAAHRSAQPQSSGIYGTS